MRKHYFDIIVLCILGAICIYLLIPSKRTLALMYEQSRKYALARQQLEELLAMGDESINVVFPLAKIYEQQGESRKTIALMQDYIRKNPDSTEAKLILARVYKNALYPKKYLHLLELVAKTDKRVDVLRKLAGWYEAHNQYRKMIETLLKLVELPDYRIYEYDYNKIIHYYATDYRYDQCMKYIEQMALKKHYKLSSSTLLYCFSVMIRAERYRPAKSLVCKCLLASRYDSEVVEKIIDQLIDAGQAYLAKEILDFCAEINLPKVMYSAIEYKVRLALGQTLGVYKQLKEIFLEGINLDNRIYEMLVRLAFKLNDRSMISKLAKKAEIRQFPEKLIYKYVFFAFMNNDSEMAHRLAVKLGPAILALDPALNFILSNTAKVRTVRALEKKAESSGKLTSEERAQLAYIFYKNGFSEESFLLIRNLELPDLFEAFDILSLVKTLAAYGNANHYYNLYRKESFKYSEHNRIVFQHLLLLLAVVSGVENKDLDLLISRNRELSNGNLLDAYKIADDSGEFELAVYLARLLYDRSKRSGHLLLLAEALVHNNQSSEAFGILDELIGKIRRAETVYLAAVTGQIKNLGFEDVDKARKDKAFMIIEKMLRNKDAVPSERCAAACCLVTLRRQEQAEKIFLELCRNRMVGEAQLREFISVTEGHVGEDLRNWFLRRAENTYEDRNQALADLNSLGLQHQTARIVERIYGKVEDSYLSTYLFALIDLKQDEKIKKVLKTYSLEHLMNMNLCERVNMVSILCYCRMLEPARKLFETFSVNNLYGMLSAAKIAKIYIAFAKQKEALAALGKGKLRGRKMKMVYLFLNASIGNRQVIDKFFADNPKPREQLLRDLFYFCFDTDNVELALEVSSKLYKLYPNVHNKLCLAQAFSANRHYKQALDMVEKHTSDNLKAKIIYISTVAKMALAEQFDKNGPYAPVFLRICDGLMQSDKSSEDLKLEVGYLLINAGYGVRAKKIFLEFAHRNPDIDNMVLHHYLYSTVKAPERHDFKQTLELMYKTDPKDIKKVLKLLIEHRKYGVAMMLIKKRCGRKVPLEIYGDYLYVLLKCRRMKTFAAALKKMPGIRKFSKKERVELIKVMLLARKYDRALKFYNSLGIGKKDVDPEIVRSVAGPFIVAKKYEVAIPLLLDLAKRSGRADSPDLAELVYLLDQHKHQPSVDYLISMAKKAKGHEQMKWMEYLNTLKYSKIVSEIMKEQYYNEK